MATEIDIANLALSLLGRNPITSLDEAKDEARIMKRHLPTASRAMLRSAWWHFAAHRVALAADAVAPAFGYYRRFKIPSDLVQIRYLSEGEDFLMEGEWILSDFGPPLNVVYTRWVTLGEWDALAVEALAAKLAAQTAMPLTQNTGLAQFAARVERDAMEMAVHGNAIERSPVEYDTDIWIKSRNQRRSVI